MTEAPFEVSFPDETGVKHNGADPCVSFASQRWRTLKEQLAGLEQVARQIPRLSLSLSLSLSLPLIHYCVRTPVSCLFLRAIPVRLRDRGRLPIFAKSGVAMRREKREKQAVDWKISRRVTIRRYEPIPRVT